MKTEPIEDFVITSHAALEMERRGLPEQLVRTVLAGPEQRYEVRPGRHVLQSRVTSGSPPKEYLIRVLVDVDRSPPEVVTAYRTSRIEKYWRRP
jgi:hypothetical protein